MATDIIDMKYRDMFGINPKYEKLIETKLNDTDSFHAFKVLVNRALKNLVLEIEGKVSVRLIEPRMFVSWGKYRNPDILKNLDTDVFETYTPYAWPSKILNQKIGNIYPSARLTKYVKIGLMKRGKYSNDTTYSYYLPYDFFITNNPTIKFVPTDWEHEEIIF